MAQKIRGTTDDQTQMMLGQIRKVFDPDWIQGFEGGTFTVQFSEEPEAEKELVNFADMYGFSLRGKSNSVWSQYYFE